MRDIIGHENILDFFEKVIQNDNLSHAYCFVGPNHVGKRAVAQQLAAQVLGLESSKLRISPDFSVVEQSINEKTEKLRKDISIDQVRVLIKHLQQSSFVKDGYKVAVIDQVDLLSLGAANALLKTLEEPRKKTLLFLVTASDEKLLPTIKSRCQVINFLPVSEVKIKDLLEC